MTLPSTIVLSVNIPLRPAEVKITKVSPLYGVNPLSRLTSRRLPEPRLAKPVTASTL